MIPMRSADVLKTLAVNALDLSGLTRLMKPFYGGRGAILAFHRIVADGTPVMMRGNAVTVSHLRGILQFVKRNKLRVIQLGEIPEYLSQSDSQQFVAITIDDGYRDNLDQGLPVFQEFNAPFAVFPCTGFLGRSRYPWYAVLEELCLRRDRVVLTSPTGGRVEFVRGKGEDRGSFFQRIEACGWPEAHMEQCMAAACESQDVRLTELLDGLFLSWEQLKQMAADPLCMVGVHTVSHAMLATLPLQEAEWEIRSAREEIENRLGVRVEHIAYPYGSPEACGPREFELAQRLGFAIGMTTLRGNILADHRYRLHSLPRHTISMTPHGAGLGYLRISLNGLWNSPFNGTIISR